MRLTKVAYQEFPNSIASWEVQEFTLSAIDLLVGKNASGKSRTLNLIVDIARLIAGTKPTFHYNSGHWRLTFEVESADELPTERQINYELTITSGAVAFEHLWSVNTEYVTRGADGIGKLLAAQVDRPLDFQLSGTQLAVTAKRDAIQHPYLNPLNRWATSVRMYLFAADADRFVPVMVGQDQAVDTAVTFGVEEPLAALISKGLQQFGAEFATSICGYMNELAYPVDAMQLIPMPMPQVIVTGMNQVPLMVAVIEHDIGAALPSRQMSGGMYRALAILVRTEIARRLQSPVVLLIDDIGEGLDFERARSLIRVLIRIAGNNDIQLIMATNDRFVMNEVPLDYWCVVVRTKGTVRVVNRRNSPKLFERFEEFGFNNFDFFAKDFYLSEDGLTTPQ